MPADAVVALRVEVSSERHKWVGGDRVELEHLSCMPVDKYLIE